MTTDRVDRIATSSIWGAIQEASHKDPSDATRLIVESFGSRLLLAIRHRVGQQIQSRVDPEDIANTVWATFLRHFKSFDLHDSTSLFALLIRIAMHKIARVARTRADDALLQELHECGVSAVNDLRPDPVTRDYNKSLPAEVDPDSFFKVGRFDDSFFTEDSLRMMSHDVFAERNLGTSERPGKYSRINSLAVLEAEERIDSLDPDLQEIALLKLAGWSAAEIASQLDFTSRTVERRIEFIREKWSDSEAT